MNFKNPEHIKDVCDGVPSVMIGSVLSLAKERAPCTETNQALCQQGSDGWLLASESSVCSCFMSSMLFEAHPDLCQDSNRTQVLSLVLSLLRFSSLSQGPAGRTCEVETWPNRTRKPFQGQDSSFWVTIACIWQWPAGVYSPPSINWQSLMFSANKQI